jgi:hypothetical protein
MVALGSLARLTQPAVAASDTSTDLDSGPATPAAGEVAR